MDKNRWQQLMPRLGVNNKHQSLVGTTYFDLCAAYNEPHRHYHNQSHIQAALKHLDAVQGICPDSAELELALWFHDAIYKPFSSSNEQDSADWAVRFMRDCGLAEAQLQCVHDLIMATLHEAAVEAPLQQWMVDIDLGILGAAADVYAQFEANVRKEYSKVPGILYRRKRKQVLRHFLQQPTVYYTAYFQERFEVQARENLAAAIASL